MTNTPDEFEGKGAVEQDKPQQATNTSLSKQLGHRDQDPMLKDSDTDFPEDGNSPEHTGEPEEGSIATPPADLETVDQDPGERQKRNQTKRDPRGEFAQIGALFVKRETRNAKRIYFSLSMHSFNTSLDGLTRSSGNVASGSSVMFSRSVNVGALVFT